MKTWYVTLQFSRGCDFSSIEDATTKQNAIDQARKYARACGWSGAIKKAVVIEQQTQGAVA